MLVIEKVVVVVVVVESWRLHMVGGGEKVGVLVKIVVTTWDGVVERWW